jgi:hypothetical protein
LVYLDTDAWVAARAFVLFRSRSVAMPLRVIRIGVAMDARIVVGVVAAGEHAR